MKSYDVVLVLWRDIVCDNEWTNNIDKIKSEVIYSVGIKLKETDTDLIMATGVSEDDTFLSVIAIPLGTIFKVEKIGSTGGVE